MGGANLWPGDAQRPLTPGLVERSGVGVGVPHARALEEESPGFKPVSATYQLRDGNRNKPLVDAQPLFFQWINEQTNVMDKFF